MSQSTLPFCSPSPFPDCFPDRSSSCPSPLVRAAFLSSGFYWSWWLLDQLANSYLNVHVGTKAHTSVWLFVYLLIETVSGLGFQSSCLSLPSVWIPAVCHHTKLGPYSFRDSAEFCSVLSSRKGRVAFWRVPTGTGVWLSELWSWCSRPRVPSLFSFDST